MGLRLHDTLRREKVEFEPMEEGTVRMYNCGPTVYDYAHIGNFAAFLLADLLRRTLEWKGFDVHQVMNVTDVGHMTEDTTDEGEDKMAVALRRVKRERGTEDVSPIEVARFYEEAFMEDKRTLRILPAHEDPRATEHIDEMIAQVETLVERGHAYVTDEGNVYFDVTTFPDYGKLSGNTLEDLEAGKRVAVREEKRNPADFALWKHDPKHLMQWDSPWGRGFPGWHIECSAMGMAYLGNTFDIHTGGEDNIFPHHESEIAQAEGATGEPFCRYWVHQRHILVEGEKMSKSLGNFYTVRDLLEKGYSGRELRYALISTHYRTQANFTLEGLEAARSALERIDRFTARCREDREGDPSPELPGLVDETLADFEAALDDDLNVSEALGVLHQYIKTVNSLDLGDGDGERALAPVESMDRVLAVVEPEEEVAGDVDEEAIAKLVREREEARAEKDWERADALREELEAMDVELEDRPDGSTIWRVKRG